MRFFWQVGSLVSCFLSRRGFEVELFEMRGDIRRAAQVSGKSINLALSERGRAALRALGLEEELIRDHAIPMRGRLIHDLSGKRRAIPYGQQGQAIYSVGRRHLNELLLTEAEKHSNVHLNFNHKLLGIDFEKNLISFEDKSKTRKEFNSKLIIGCDGAHSAVRRSLMKSTRADFSQEYIDHGYIELSIPADEQGHHRMEVNFLHIWPRGTFMMIALPNQDGSYTVTLFMPFEWFDSINSESKLVDFFEANFPDAIPLIGE